MTYKNIIKEIEQNICFNKETTTPIKYLKSEMASLLEYCDTLNQNSETTSKISAFNNFESIMIIGWHFLKDKITEEESGMAFHAFHAEEIKEYIAQKEIEFTTIKDDISKNNFSLINKSNLHIYYYIIENDSNILNKEDLLNTCVSSFINKNFESSKNLSFVDENFLLPDSFKQNIITFNYIIHDNENRIGIKNNKHDTLIITEIDKNERFNTIEDQLRVVISILKHFNDTDLFISNNNFMKLLQKANQQNLFLQGNKINSSLNIDNIIIESQRMPENILDTSILLLREQEIKKSKRSLEHQDFNPYTNSHFKKYNPISLKNNLKK